MLATVWPTVHIKTTLMFSFNQKVEKQLETSLGWFTMNHSKRSLENKSTQAKNKDKHKYVCTCDNHRMIQLYTHAYKQRICRDICIQHGRRIILNF